jgi:hypothetical protein
MQHNVVAYSEIHDNQVFVYVRGRLIYKKWLNTGRSATFHTAPEGIRWNDGPTSVSKVRGDRKVCR